MASADAVTAYAAATHENHVECLAVRQAAARHLRDLERQRTPDFPFYFDADEARDRIAFFGLARHIKGEWAGQRIALEPWQCFCIGSTFGWKRVGDGMRRFRVAYNEVPRGQGKSTTAAVVGINAAFFDREPGAEVFFAATKRDQAKICFNVAREIVRRSPKLNARLQVLVGNISQPSTASKLEALGADADSMDGLRVHVAVVDELHAHRTRAVVDVLDSATGTRRQPLLFFITTAGASRQSVCWQYHDYAMHVLSGAYADESFFAFIACADEGDDPFAESTWRKANPSLGVCVKVDDLRRKADVARRQPAALNEFLRKHLNVWTSQSVRFFDMARWATCATTVPVAELADVPCYGGLDLGLSDDLSAFVLVWAMPDGRLVTRCRFWVPQGALERFPHRPYDVWQRSGALTVTDGDVADFDRIEADILEWCSAYQVREVSYDRRFANQLAQHLLGAGVACIDQQQGFALNEALRKVSTAVADGTLCHGNDPILAWMAGNAQVRHGRNGEIRLDKEKSAEKVDGISALSMAVSRVIAQPIEQPSVYESRGALWF